MCVCVGVGEGGEGGGLCNISGFSVVFVSPPEKFSELGSMRITHFMYGFVCVLQLEVSSLVWETLSFTASLWVGLLLTAVETGSSYHHALLLFS